MPRLSALAVNAAISHIKDRRLGTRAAGPLQTLLVFKRMHAEGEGWSIAGVEDRVRELFVVLPDDPRGRLSLAGGRDLWGVREQSGRKTVWDNATRTGARELFEPPGAYVQETDEHHPLRDDAVDVALEKMPSRVRGHLVAGDALAVLVQREHEFPEGTQLQDVVARARELFDLTTEEWGRLTGPAELPDLPLFEGTGNPPQPPWTPAALQEDLRPEPEVTAVADRRVHREAAVIPLRLDDRTRRMVRLSILSTSAVLLVGPPGTGKTRLLRAIVDELLDSHPEFQGVGAPLWSTPEESWTSRDIVGGPTVVPGTHEIRFRPGLVPRTIAANRWLILDELNRGDADRIFGGLITWLSDQPVDLGRITEEADSPAVRLEWGDALESAAVPNEEPLKAGRPDQDVVYCAGRAWRLLGTYNGQDAQRVFRFGQALGRRFQQVPVPAMEPDDFAGVLAELGADEALPPAVTQRIVETYRAHYADPDTRLGPASFFKIRTYLAQALERPAESAPGDEADMREAVGMPGTQGRAVEEPLGTETTSGAQGESGVPESAAAHQRGPADLDELLAEGYVISLGQRLAALDDAVRGDLRARVLAAGALSEEQWAWLEDRIRDFS